MIKIPFEQLVEKIKKEGNISEDEINEKVNDKMKQLSGLISKEGAAHIIANELGIKLFEAFSGKLQIKNIVAGLRNVETVGKVMQTYELREFTTKDRKGKVASFMMGDETSSIRVVMWGDQAENISNIKPGNIVKIVGSYVKENNGFNELHLNEKSKLIINPEGETIDLKQKQIERKTIDKLQENDNAIEILATIVQIFEPRFYEVCPECSKRLKVDNETFLCSTHNQVHPDYSYVLNIVVDDGTDNIRTVFFRENMEKLTKLSREKILAYKENPEKFEEIKTELLGNLIKLNGRVKKNLFFDRLEFVANQVSLNPNPEEEVKRLNAEKAESN